jgi:uncharacterized protein YfaA (DUF2138 family)
MKYTDQLVVNKSVMEVCHFTDTHDEDDVAYWRSRSPIDRLIGLGTLRQAFYDYDLDTERLSSFFEVVRPAQG